MQRQGQKEVQRVPEHISSEHLSRLVVLIQPLMSISSSVLASHTGQIKPQCPVTDKWPHGRCITFMVLMVLIVVF